MGVPGVLEDIATVAQLSGLHAVMLIALAARLLRIPQCEAECARLDECARRLRALLQGPATSDVAKAMVAGVLVEADGLVGSYRRSTHWRRFRTARSMEARLRGMQDRVDCLWALLLCAHANNLLAVHHVISDPSHGAETCDSAPDSQSYDNGTVQGGGAGDPSDITEAGEFESAV